jgi:hypothetical protein
MNEVAQRSLMLTNATHIEASAIGVNHFLSLSRPSCQDIRYQIPNEDKNKNGVPVKRRRNFY